MGEVASDVTSDAVPHGNRLDIGQVVDHLLVCLEISAELVRVFVDEFERHSLDVCGSDSSHIVHRVRRIKWMPYLNVRLSPCHGYDT